MDEKRPPTAAQVLKDLAKHLHLQAGTCPEAPEGWTYVGKVEDATGCWCTYTHEGPPAGTLRIACD